MPRDHHKSTEQRVLEALKKNLKGDETLIIGVSGGADSVFLLNCLLKFKRDNPIKIVVAHVNHMLRGKEAEEDLEFVEKLSAKNKLTFESKKVDVKALSKTHKLSVEESGREIRYEFFKKLFKKHKADYLLTAHHSDDNLETIMLNFIRGASLKGIHGMRIKAVQTNGLAIFRPLLCVSKQDILDHMKKHKIKFRTDYTNFDLNIPRNFVRHRIIPELKKLNSNISQTISKNSVIFQEIQEHFDTEAQNWIKKNALYQAKKYQGSRSRKKKFLKDLHDIRSFNLLPRPIQKEVILLIYKNKEGTTKNIESSHIDEVLKIINKNVGNKKKRLGKYLVEIKQGTFIIRANRALT